jgi:hypothetical protein
MHDKCFEMKFAPEQVQAVAQAAIKKSPLISPAVGAK